MAKNCVSKWVILMNSDTNHAKGLLITTLGVLILTPDTLLIRLVDIDQWSMIVWRGVLMALGLLVVVVVVERGNTIAAFRRTGRSGLGVARCFAVSSITFVFAVQHTSVANTLIIVATSPMFAAVLAWKILGEKTPRRTIAAIAATTCGILVVFSDGSGHGGWAGDLSAMVTALAMAGVFVLTRKRRDINMVPAAAAGAGLAALLVIASGLSAPFAVTTDQVPWLLIMGLFVLPVSFGLITVGPRYIPAPEVGLLLLLETVLGPIWVWLATGEGASQAALVGGAIVVVTLSIHAILGLRQQTAKIDL